MSKKANGAITWHHDRRQLGALVPWEHNPRLIKKEQAARLLESLETFGQIHAIAVGPENQIYDGHQRDAVWAASNKYGPAYEVDVRVSNRALTDKERAKLVVYLHKGTAGEFDFDALANLPEVDLADLTSWGFDESELVGFGGEEGGDADADVDLDQAAELNKKWKVKTGDLWLIGNHRLVCADSTQNKDVSRLFDGKKAQLVATDPPYGVKYGDKLDAANLVAHRVRSIQNDDLNATDLQAMWTKAFQVAAEHSVEGGAIYAAAAAAGDMLLASLQAFNGSGYTFKWQLVWLKDQIVLSRADYHFIHENILYGWKEDGAHYFVADRTQQSVFEYPRPKSSEEHPTMKPVPLYQHLITNSSKPGEIVYDPFMGSGTTMVAAENLARRCYGLEINSGYCAVILERMTIAFPGIKIERQ